MRLEAVILSLVLLAPTAIAWTQFHGDASRNPVILLDDGPLDVVANITLREGANVQTFFSAAGVLTPDGPVILARFDGECVLLTFLTPGETTFASTPLGPCGFQRLVGYNPLVDFVYVCTFNSPGGPVLQAFERTTGALRWSIVPAEAFGVVGNEGWMCGGGAFDPEAQELVLPFSAMDAAGTDHRLAAIDAVTGEVKWAKTVKSIQPPSTDTPAVDTLGSTVAETTLHPWGVTLTTTGVITTGWVYPCATCTKTDEAFTAWFRRDGTPVGFERTNTGSIGDTSIVPTTRPFPLSSFPVAKGPVAAGIFAGEITLYNPEVARPAARASVESIEPATSSLFYPAGAWVGDRIVMGLPHSVVAFDSNLRPAWSWGEGFDLEVSDIVVTSPRTVNVLLGKAGTVESKIVQLDAGSGTVLSEIPLPVSPARTGTDRGWYAAFIPDGAGGLLVVDVRGNVIALGQADPTLRPSVTSSNAYPQPGRTFTLNVAAPASGTPVRYDVDWGDGTRERITQPGAVTHIFAEADLMDVRVLALHDDGRTATESFLVSVGGTPPADLSAIQRAFAPDRADLTFGMIGIILTLIGAIYTVSRTRLRVSRLERELAVVEEMRLMATERPLEAVRALRAYRAALPTELGRGRLDNAQFQVLDGRAARLLRLLKTRLLAPFDARFSDGYRRILDAAFEDATLGQLEFDALLDGLRREPHIAEADRVRISQIIAEFTPFGDGATSLGHAPGSGEAGDVANNA